DRRRFLAQAAGPPARMDSRQVDPRLRPVRLPQPLACRSSIAGAGERPDQTLVRAIEQVSAPRRLQPRQEPRTGSLLARTILSRPDPASRCPGAEGQQQDTVALAQAAPAAEIARRVVRAGAHEWPSACRHRFTRLRDLPASSRITSSKWPAAKALVA